MVRKRAVRKKSTKKVITAKQKSARRKNIAVARSKKKKGSSSGGGKSKAWFTKGGNKMAPVEKAVSNLPRKTMKVKPVKLTAAEQAYMNRVLGG